MAEEKSTTRYTEQEDTSYDHVLKYTGVFGGVQVLTMLVSVIRNKFAALWLSRAGMGFFMMYSNISSFVSSASNAGIPFSAVKYLSEIYEEGDADKMEKYVSTVRSMSLWSALLGALLCVLLAPLISFFAFDGDWGYTLEVALLSPMIFAIAVTNGEISILKAARKLKCVAVVSIVAALSTLVSVLPFFYIWGSAGVIPALVVNSIVLMLVHLYYSLRLFPWRVSLFSSVVWCEGLSMIKMGVPYVIAGVLNSLTALAIPAVMLCLGSMTDVGLYKVGYGLMVVYAGMVFVAVETDYFPRLSAVHNNLGRMNYAINQQIDICVLFMAPLLLFIILAMPLVIRMLYSADFLPVVDMAVCSAFYMFFKAVMLPIGYTSLAKGDSVVFLVMEVAYDAFSFVIITLGFYWGGITGMGIGLSLSSLLDVLMVSLCYSHKYGFRFFPSTLRMIFVQALFLAAGVLLCIQGVLWLRVFLGSFLLFFSAFYSFAVLKKRTSIVDGLKRKFCAGDIR